jgi:hypothetical protein
MDFFHLVVFEKSAMFWGTYISVLTWTGRLRIAVGSNWAVAYPSLLPIFTYVIIILTYFL